MKKIINHLAEFICLLVIFLIIAGFCIIRYQLYKNKQEAIKPYREALTSQSIEEINSQKSTLWPRIKDFAKSKVKAIENIVNGDSSEKSTTSIAKKTDDNTNTLLHFDVSSEYDSFIFDNTLFMFEGDQSGKTVKHVLDRMIETAGDELLSNPNLTVKNMGVLNGTILDDTNYISKIETIRNNIIDEDTYNISFGYNKLKPYVNEVIIEKR